MTVPTHQIAVEAPVHEFHEVAGKRLFRAVQYATIDGLRYERWSSQFDEPPTLTGQRWWLRDVDSDRESPQTICACGVSAVIPLCMTGGDSTVRCLGCGTVDEL